MPIDEEALDLDAARVALVALFGMVPSYESVSADRVRVAPDAATLTFDQAARLLASMPKPLICVAENSSGTLQVTCELLAEASEAEQERYALRREANNPGLFHHLVERYGEGDHLIAAFGHEQCVVVSRGAADRWLRDYELDLASWRADDSANARAAADPMYLEARRRGAQGILIFPSMASHVMTHDGRRFRFPLPESASPEERSDLEHVLVDLARTELVAMSDEDELSAVERELVDRGAIPADTATPGGPYLERYWHRILASQMGKFFEGRAMPPEVDAFVDACREL